MRKLTLLFILGLAISAFAGCGGSSVQSVAPTTWTQGSAQDRADLLSDAGRYPEFIEDPVYEADLPMSSLLPAQVGSLAAQAEIDPITFRRRVHVVTRSFEFAFTDTDSVGRPTRAILTITKELTGTFNILADDTTGSFNRPQTIKKTLSEHWTRRLEFVRQAPPPDEDGDDDGDDDDGHGSIARRNVGTYGNGKGHGHGHGDSKRGNWELTAVSLIDVDSQEAGTEIMSVQFQAAGLDTTISDPQALIAVGSLPALAPGTEVTVTVTTNAADDIVLLLTRNHRARLQSNGPNTYSGTFTLPASLGCHHFGVDAISHATLFDSVAPYDSETWLFPIRAVSGALATR